MAEERKLEPAKHFVQPPSDGWKGSDLSEDDLVDDQFIADDPDSKVVYRRGSV